MVNLRAQARDIQQRINGEIDKIVASLKNQVTVEEARETALQDRLTALKQRMTQVNQNEIRLHALERDADANRDLLTTLLARQKEAISQQDPGFQQPDATVISFADVPTDPSFPRRSVVLALAFVGALVIGTLCVLILELLDAGFRSGEQLEQVTGLPSIGMVPVTDRPKEFATLAGYVIGRPRTAFSEAFRTLNWGIKLASHPSAPRVTLITSAGTGEGKTTIACCYAAKESVAGKKVILIDGDVRRPSVHTHFGRDLEPGLTNVLAGDASLDSAIVASEWSGLSILPAGTFSPHAPNVLDSDRMKSLMQVLRQRFDQVIIDSPPVLVGADAQILSGLADATVFLVHWGKTRRPVVSLALRQLRAGGAKLAGGVLTMVDVKKNASYGFGDSGTYAGAMSNYYLG
jgi:capsular exopolysaccharide synthesis family protein